MAPDAYNIVGRVRGNCHRGKYVLKNTKVAWQEYGVVTVKRHVVIFTILLTLIMPGLVAFGSPPRQDELSLSVSAGYNGYFRQGQWTALRVALVNTGDNLTGQLRVRTSGTSGLNEVIYRTPVDLPGGSRKQIFLYVSLESYTTRVRVEITDHDGRVVETANVNVRMANDPDTLYAVVTESPYGAVDMTGHAPGVGSAYQTNWELADIPPLAEALEGLDVMLFHDVDTGAMSAEQVSAVSNWVLSGGHLIIAGGDAWQRTTAGLQDLLPVSLQGTTPAQSLAPLADYLRLPSDSLMGDITVTQTTPLESARVIVAVDSDTPLIVRSRHGGGVVDFLAVDPHAEPLRSWNDKNELWYTLVTSRGQRPSWSRGISSWSTAREATLTMTNTALPTFLQLCGFLVMYILLVGPVNYFVLKRLNRRELAWFTIPALIIGFSVLAYSVGFNLRGNTATVNRLTVVRVWNGEEQAELTSLIGVQSPRRNTYDVAVQHGYTLRTMPDSEEMGVPVTITEGTRYIADSIPIDAGMVASFAASGYVPAPPLESSVIWHLPDGRGQAAIYVSGSVTNTTGLTLEDTVVLIKGESRYLGTLEPNESASFTITVGPQDAAPLTLGNSLDEYTTYYGYRWQYSSPGWCFYYEGMPLTIMDVMRNEEFPCSVTGIGSRQQEVRRRYRLLGAMVVDTESSGGRGTGAYLFGWAQNPLLDVELIDKPQAEEDTTLYLFELPVQMEAQDAEIEIPPGLTVWEITDTNDPLTQLTISPTDFQVGNIGQAAFKFRPMPPLRLDAVSALVLEFQYQGQARVDLWNWEQGKWVELDLSNPNLGTGPTYIISHPEPYIGPEDTVSVRVRPVDTALYTNVEYIQIAYRGTLAE